MLVVRGSRVILPDGERPASIHIEHGLIARIGVAGEHPKDAELFDAGDRIVAPGIVDTHVHVNEPGRADWEGFDTATRAAAAGGVTTIVDMPLNSIPATTTVEALEAKRNAARDTCHVDVAFWGGVVPGNARELNALVDAGVRGFKCFLAPSGVDEFPAVAERDLREAMPVIARRQLPLLVHAESPAHLRPFSMAAGADFSSTGGGAPPPPRADADASIGRYRSSLSMAAGAPGSTHPIHATYQSYLSTRPPEAEVGAIELMVRLASEFRARVHIVHVACAEAVEAIERARRAGISITAETCPHYLTFAADEIPDGATEFKCAPPIREMRHRDALWRALASGALDLIATDHSPSLPALKCPGDFAGAWGGIASLELSLAAVWNGARERLADGRATDLARWMSAAPAALAGLTKRKGRIAPGHDADFAIWDPDRTRAVEPSALQQRHKLTPYAGRRLRGVVTTTFVRGRRVWDDGALVTERGGLLL